MTIMRWTADERYVPGYGDKKPGDEFDAEENDAKAFERQGDAKPVLIESGKQSKTKGREVTFDE